EARNGRGRRAASRSPGAARTRPEAPTADLAGLEGWGPRPATRRTVRGRMEHRLAGGSGRLRETRDRGAQDVPKGRARSGHAPALHWSVLARRGGRGGTALDLR